MGDRRQARELALMLLYQLDVAKGPATTESAMERFFAAFGDGAPLDPPPPYAEERAEPVEWSPAARAYAEVLVRGAVAHAAEIDEAIQAASTHWRLDRMARVDRNILRLGAYEILHGAEEVPRNAAINEAIEIAKRFGTQESPAFINGILDRIGRASA